MTSFSGSENQPAPRVPRGNELQALIEQAHKLRAEATGRLMRKLFGLAPVDQETGSLGTPLPREG